MLQTNSSTPWPSCQTYPCAGGNVRAFVRHEFNRINCTSMHTLRTRRGNDRCSKPLALGSPCPSVVAPLQPQPARRPGPCSHTLPAAATPCMYAARSHAPRAHLRRSADSRVLSELPERLRGLTTCPSSATAPLPLATEPAGGGQLPAAPGAEAGRTSRPAAALLLLPPPRLLLGPSAGSPSSDQRTLPASEALPEGCAVRMGCGAEASPREPCRRWLFTLCLPRPLSLCS